MRLKMRYRIYVKIVDNFPNFAVKFPVMSRLWQDLPWDIHIRNPHIDKNYIINNLIIRSCDIPPQYPKHHITSSHMTVEVVNDIRQEINPRFIDFHLVFQTQSEMTKYLLKKD